MNIQASDDRIDQFIAPITHPKTAERRLGSAPSVVVPAHEIFDSIRRVARNKTPGLVVASRSMNVRREELQQWNLQAAIYSTKSLRICAASAPSVVLLAHGIFDSTKAREVPVARETSRPREETAGEAIRRIDALCPWLVGAERREIRRRAS